jgi:arylsulfatase A-like enzyme/Tfp pilus assembly protein PilF
MPRLRALARRGVAFTRAYAQIPLTVPSHATLLTGLDPRHHGVRDNLGYALPEDLGTLATRLSGAGYRCGGFVGGYPLAARHGHGLDRGFEVYDDRLTRGDRGASGSFTERRGEEVVQAALAWLDTVAPGAPFFLWVHLYDPHDPYEAPGPWSERKGHPYDAEVAYTDQVLGDLVARLERGGRLKGGLVVIAGDHGEMLGEKGESTHGIFLYEAALRVPLVFYPAPGGTPRVVREAIPLEDVAPTILDLAGLGPWEGTDGRTLRPLLTGGEDTRTNRGFYLETLHPRRRYGWSPLRGLLAWPYKYVTSSTTELYNLRDDAGETRNLQAPEIAADLSRRLSALSGEQVWGDAAHATLDENVRLLASLGYVGATGGSRSDLFRDMAERPAPAARIRVLPVLERGLEALERGDTTTAARFFERGLKLDPENVLLLHNRGIAAMMLGRPAEAERWMRRAIAREPLSDNLFNDLGLALVRQDRLAAGEQAYREALSLSPGFLPARLNLALCLIRQQKKEEARRELAPLQERDPDFPGLREALQAAAE